VHLAEGQNLAVWSANSAITDAGFVAPIIFSLQVNKRPLSGG
jgi:hypothetical protein